MIFKFIYVFINPMEDKSQEIFRFFAPLRMTGREPEFRLWYQMLIGSLLLHLFVNPVRNSSEALNPAEIFIKSNPAAAAGPGSAQEGLLPRREGLWPGGSSGALFLTG